MGPVHSPKQQDRRPPSRWRRAVCVLGLLAGVLAMHGLAPGGGAPEHSHARSAAVAAAHHDACPDGHCGGHARHADPSCASAAVGGGPVLPVPAADPVPAPAPAGPGRSCPSADPDGGRAPPDLAELQLLRI
ncbi:DUF6153 family protein [Streptomyces sp. NPDC085946]|uniref:DUF6153 family protein n=1 Tax=Streptomyces sp. NPDC085946 TaxID=3365744 RepID=UPI0037CF47FF